MKFSQLVAILATTALAANASAYSEGTLRRSTQVAQADYAETTHTATKEVNININTNTAAQAQQQAVAQPATVVEAAPVSESKAEALRKARIGAEVQTEQRIVEKLEDSRLQEERARADRLFGNKLDPAPAPAPVAPPPPPVVVAPAPVPAPVPEKATQVTIEKVEIIQPAYEKRQEEEVVESKIKSPQADETPAAKPKYYISGLAGNMAYSASNVKSSYALGVAVGTIIEEQYGVELSYLYSSHEVDTYWQAPLYRSMDQNDVALAGKYYVLTGKLKPYVGASVTYINRKYTERVQQGYYWYANPNTQSEATNAVNLGVLGGVDFAFTERFMLGVGADYNFNAMNTSEIRRNSYGLPENTEPLEKLSYWTLKFNAKFVF